MALWLAFVKYISLKKMSKARTKTGARKRAGRKMVTQGKMMDLLRACHLRMTAMNASPAHAASWVEPKSSSTTRFLERLAEVTELGPSAQRKAK